MRKLLLLLLSFLLVVPGTNSQTSKTGRITVQADVSTVVCRGLGDLYYQTGSSGSGIGLYECKTLGIAPTATAAVGNELSNPVSSDGIQFVKNGGSDATGDGFSWAGAKATHNAAITALPAAGGILYSAGDFTFSSDAFASVTKNVHLVVVNGELSFSTVSFALPKNITLEILTAGRLNASSAVTINGTFIAGTYPVFRTSGSGVVNVVSPADGLLNGVWWGARAVDPNTAPATTGVTASINSGTPTVTLSTASSFKNGDGVVIRKAGASHAMSTPGGPTVQESVAAAGTGTGIVVNAPAGGGETYSYKIAARNKAGGLTAASTAGVTSAGFTLGARSVTISTLSRSNATVTVTTSSAHELSVGSMVYVKGTSDNTNFGGWFIVDTVADTTHFTFSNGLDTRQGAAASATGGTANWFNCNHLTWSAVTGAWEYYIYGRISGSETLIGVSRPQDATVTDLTFDDFGSPMMDGIILPPYVPSTPPGAATSDNLVTTIVSGAGTTTLTLAVNAGTTVSGAIIQYDAAPNILKVATAAAARGAFWLPQSVGQAYVVNSYLNLSALTAVGFAQSGTLYLNETLEYGSNTQWYGYLKPQPTGAPAFSWQPGATVTVNSANPGIYQGGRNSNSYFGLSIQGQANAGVLYVGDRLNNATFDTVNFITSTSSTDYMGVGLLLRGITNDTSFSILLNKVSIGGGPTQSPGNSATPIFYCNKCGQTIIHDLQGFRRGIFFRAVASGLDLTVNGGRWQGGIVPFLSLYHSGGAASGQVTVRNYETDTTAQALVANLSATANDLTAGLTLTTINDPSSDAGTSPGRVTGRPFNSYLSENVGVGSAGSISGQNKNTDFSETGTSKDGILATGGTEGRYLLRRFNSGVGVGNSYSLFVNGTVPTAPSGTPSAGGSVPVGAHTYKIVPVWHNDAEGIYSPASATVDVTGGNQTVALTWTAVTGNPKGYNVYRDGALGPGGCSVPTTTTNSFTDTFSFTCGTSSSTLPSGGPVGLSAAVGAWGPSAKFEKYTSITNCADSAGDAACGSSSLGSIVIDASDTNTVVSTTAVTANSQIHIQEDSSLGTRLGVTCNTTTGRLYTVTARVAGTSFTVTASAAPTTNPACLSYKVEN